MPEFKYLNLPADVASAAAIDAVTTLNNAIQARGQATWVLAGGSSPMAAYRMIVAQRANCVDWSKVKVVIGDERSVPVTDPDSNWGQIAPVLFASEPTASIVQHRPLSELSSERAASHYGEVLGSLPAASNGAPHFDLVWLGVGEDGHTLSLFPDHPDFRHTKDLVIPVRNSPKPPSDRITLTTRALEGTVKAVVFAVGAGKKQALGKALAGEALPVAQVTAHIEGNGGQVIWMFDEAARPR